MKSQEEGYEQILNKTREHGTIIMTIKNLHKKIAEGGKDFVLFNKIDEYNPMVKNEDQNESIDKKADKSLEQLGVISEFVEFFQDFNKKYQGQFGNEDKKSEKPVNNLETVIEALDKGNDRV